MLHRCAHAPNSLLYRAQSLLLCLRKRTRTVRHCDTCMRVLGVQVGRNICIRRVDPATQNRIRAWVRFHFAQTQQEEKVSRSGACFRSRLFKWQEMDRKVGFQVGHAQSTPNAEQDHLEGPGAARAPALRAREECPDPHVLQGQSLPQSFVSQGLLINVGLTC